MDTLRYQNMVRAQERILRCEQTRHLYEKGYLPTDIAKILGLSPHTVNDYWHVLDLPPTKLAVIQAERAQRQQRVRSMTLRGYSIGVIAETLDVTQRTVQRDRHDIGCRVAPPQRRWTDDEIATAEAMLADGCSLGEIGRTLGRSYPAVCRKFQGRGWTAEQASEFMSLRHLRDKLGA
jgi:hypothetical protein